MEVGDLILTPSWVWHDHGHDGDVPVVWLDGLDIPLVRHLGPVFAEPYLDMSVGGDAPPETIWRAMAVICFHLVKPFVPQTRQFFTIRS